MEEIEQFEIPTLSRSRISQQISYPIGAEAISHALSSCDQKHGLGLHFYTWSDNGFRRGLYEFLRVEYLKNASPVEDWPVSNLWRRPPQHRWEIIVHPVPREERNATKLFILEQRCPKFNNGFVIVAD